MLANVKEQEKKIHFNLIAIQRDEEAVNFLERSISARERVAQPQETQGRKGMCDCLHFAMRITLARR